MANSYPSSTKALIIEKSTEPRQPIYHDARIVHKPVPALKPGEVLVKINAAGFNHRELWIRKGQYPGIVFGSTMGADGAGTVVAAHDAADELLHQRVFLTPTRGWETDPLGPEGTFGILGGGAVPPIGTFSSYVAVARDQVLRTPAHLDDVHAAAWPVGGVTAWRAVVVNARVQRGHTVLITGIGGGVALLALQLCRALGARAYVTSGSPAKLARARELGAAGGVNYKDKDWPQQLEKQLGGTLLDAVIDSAGGAIVQQAGRVLRAGGRIVLYGMTAAPAAQLTMREVLRNQQLLGSTMGSKADLQAATEFIAEHRIVPVVSHVFDGLEAVEEGFALLARGEQFGKVVVRVDAAGAKL
ncbi:NAD-P-binding protein [Gloeopeniophorella convolvens]|nr:NAD-P-binding protein [Gloeopeniophorella convolvens]